MYPKDDIDNACKYLLRNSVSLNSMRLLITGATGFVGSWLLNVTDRMQKEYGQDIKVFGISRDLQAAQSRLGGEVFNHVQWLKGSVEHIDLSRLGFTHVIHAATPTTVETGATDRIGVYNASVGGLINILRTTTTGESKIRVLHTSSGAVYQGQVDEFGRSNLNLPVMNERSLNNLKYPGYLEAKLDTEKLILETTKNGLISGVNARLFAFYGPGLPTNSHYAIGNFMHDALYKNSIVINGSGRAIRSYLSGYKMASSILYALASSEETPFNVGSMEGKTLAYWAEQIDSILQYLNNYDQTV